MCLLVATAAPAAAKPAGKGAAPAAPPFLLQPTSMDLAIDETQELTVYAFPTSEGPFADVIMCGYAIAGPGGFMPAEHH